MGDVRGHLPQIGQAILAGQFPVLDFQLVGEPADFRAQGRVRLFQRSVAPCQAASTVCRSALLSSVMGSGNSAVCDMGCLVSGVCRQIKLPIAVDVRRGQIGAAGFVGRVQRLQAAGRLVFALLQAAALCFSS